MMTIFLFQTTFLKIEIGYRGPLIEISKFRGFQTGAEKEG
jgi:hypothetical protein